MILASRRATVVLPAPLSPTTAVTLPASRRTDTRSTALTGTLRASGPRPFLTQKCLVRSRPSRTGVVVLTVRGPPREPARVAPARRELLRLPCAASRRRRVHWYQSAPAAAPRAGTGPSPTCTGD